MKFKEEIERKVAVHLSSVGLQARLDDMFTEKELSQAIKKMKRHAAPGPDQIPNVLLRKQGRLARQALLAVLNRVWVSGDGRVNGERARSCHCSRTERVTDRTSMTIGRSR